MASAIVIGGGLAGISAAWELSRRDWKVDLYESAGRLGGKAGSELSDDSKYYSDHGYHLFPAWYDNVRQLMGEVGIDYDTELIPGERFISEFKGRDDRTGLPKGGLLKRVIGGIAFAWAIGELIEADNSVLRQMSLEEFLAHTYPDEGLQEAALTRHGSLTLKALSNPANSISALTCARMWRRWMSPASNVGKPSWSALRGSLQERFIDPLETALAEQGVNIHKNTPVSELSFEEIDDMKKRVVSMKAGNELKTDLHHRRFIIAVPAEKLKGLFATKVPWAVEISDNTKTGQMSAIDYLFDPLVTITPKDHFGIGDTELTGFDITRHWDRHELPPTAVRGNAAVKTVMQVIATDSSHGDEKSLNESVKPHVADALSVEESSATAAAIHLNADAKLYLNTVENSRDRPSYCTPRKNGFVNVSLAGDYCDTTIDVASMEAAVASGRMAAEEAMGFEVTEPDTDTEWVARLMNACRFTLFPVVTGVAKVRTTLLGGSRG